MQVWARMRRPPVNMSFKRLDSYRGRTFVLPPRSKVASGWPTATQVKQVSMYPIC